MSDMTDRRDGDGLRGLDREEVLLDGLGELAGVKLSLVGGLNGECGGLVRNSLSVSAILGSDKP